MGKIDAMSRSYINRNDVFADIVNLMLYDGSRVIRPDMLVNKPTDEIQTIYEAGDNIYEKNILINRNRDVVKEVLFNSDLHGTYAIVGVEEQTDVHYAAPVKCLVYDAINYSNQVNEISRSHRDTGYRYKNSGEFLSGFTSSDKLIPIKTLIVFLNSQKWDGPRSLHEMLNLEGFSKEEILQFPDYKIEILEPFNISDEKLELLESDLKLLLGFIKNSVDKNRLTEYIDDNKGFEAVDINTFFLMNEICNTKISIPTDYEGRQINMCKAIDDMRAESREQGIIEGRAEGKHLGRADLIIKMFSKGLSVDEISNLTDISVNNINELLMQSI